MPGRVCHADCEGQGLQPHVVQDVRHRVVLGVWPEAGPQPLQPPVPVQAVSPSAPAPQLTTTLSHAARGTTPLALNPRARLIHNRFDTQYFEELGLSQAEVRWAFY